MVCSRDCCLFADLSNLVNKPELIQMLSLILFFKTTVKQINLTTKKSVELTFVLLKWQHLPHLNQMCLISYPTY